MKISKYLPVLVLAGAMVFFVYDIVVDLISGLDGISHITIEFMVFVAISAVLGREIRHIRQLDQVIVAEKSINARLAGEMLSVIRSKFDDWGLSSSESQVALLLIKGLSMKEIAEAREVKEKTVRSQAASIYAKSGQAGRHELAAYFMEDLMSEMPSDRAGEQLEQEQGKHGPGLDPAL